MILTLIVLTTLQTKVSDFEDLDPHPEPSLNLPLIGKPHNKKHLVYLDIASLCVCWGGGEGESENQKFLVSDQIFSLFIFSILHLPLSLR